MVMHLQVVLDVEFSNIGLNMASCGSLWLDPGIMIPRATPTEIL